MKKSIINNVSAVIPVYNGEKYLSQAVESVINQTMKPLEIIVVDDGSTDGTVEIARRFGNIIRYVYQDNAGAAAARNLGIELADGELVAFLDADDLWHPRKLEQQTLRFEEHEHLKIIMGLSVMCEFDSIEICEEKPADDDARFTLSFGCSTMKKTVFQDVGPLDEGLRLAEDLDWFYRARDLEQAIYVQKEIAQYCRRHEENITNNRKQVIFYHMKMMKKVRDRISKTGSGRAHAINNPSDPESVLKSWHTV